MHALYLNRNYRGRCIGIHVVQEGFGKESNKHNNELEGYLIMGGTFSHQDKLTMKSCNYGIPALAKPYAQSTSLLCVCCVALANILDYYDSLP